MSSRLPEDTSQLTLNPNHILLGDVDSSPRSSLVDDLDASNFVPSHHQQKPHLTFVNGLALVIGLQIGSGIFSAPSQVSAHVSSPTIAISTWLAGGALVYCGAVVFAELGIRLPYNGGIQEYLKHAYGDFYAFVFSWTWLIIAKPSSMAIISMVFSDYICRALIPEPWISLAMQKVVALLGLVSVTVINCLGVRSGARVASAFLWFKIFILSSIILSALAFFLRSNSVTTGRDKPTPDIEPVNGATSTWTLFGNYITALFGALYCYGGWESIGFVAGEMKNPQQDLPKVLNTAMMLVTIGFTMYNVALYSVVAFEDVANTRTPIVEFERKVLGDAGVLLYSLMIAASAMGSLNANVYATARVYVAAADKGHIPIFFSAKLTHESSQQATVSSMTRLRYLPRRMQEHLAAVLETLSMSGGPTALRRSIIMNTCVTAIYILQGSFNSLVTFVGVSEYIILLLAVVGVFNIRKKTAQMVTPEAYTVFIAVFGLVSSLIVVQGIITSPAPGVGIGLLVGVCWLMYRYCAI